MLVEDIVGMSEERRERGGRKNNMMTRGRLHGVTKGMIGRRGVLGRRK